MKQRIDTLTGRKALSARGAPYFARTAAGCAIGYRKLTAGEGTWVARWRNPATDKQIHYALGNFPDYASALKAAEKWFEQCQQGSHEVITVAVACERYVEDRRREKGESCAVDAEGRFRRHVYGKKIGRIELNALRAAHVTDWRNGLVKVTDDEDDPDAERRAKDSANRDMAALKAALNLSYRMGLVSSTAQWDRVQSFGKVSKRRERFLTLTERRLLIAAASPELKRFIRALLLTGARPGEIATAKVGDLDRNGLLTLDGKTGRRTVPVSPDALEHLKHCAGRRKDDEYLLIRDDGAAFTRFYWRDAMQVARKAAGLPADVVLYSLRHVAISEMLVGGIDPMTVARIAGTSVSMVQKHYGHLIRDRVTTQLAAVKML